MTETPHLALPLFLAGLTTAVIITRAILDILRQSSLRSARRS